MGENRGAAPRLVAVPLRPVDFDALKAALHGGHLPVNDLDQPGRWFWRFETPEELPVGFAGIEVHGQNGLLHSLVTLPPLRGRGCGSAMVTRLEFEAQLLGCAALWVVAPSTADFFTRLGFAPCEPGAAPEAIARTQSPAELLVKSLS